MPEDNVAIRYTLELFGDVWRAFVALLRRLWRWIVYAKSEED
jgi:hypothetical protein